MKSIYTILLLICFGNIVAQVEAGVPDDLVQCDVNNPGDETEVFDLTQNEAQIINGQSNVVVTYHLTSGGALSGINALPNPENYQNIANPEPIWARLQSTAGQGWSVTSFQIFVPKIPVIDTPPDDIFIDEGDGNSEAVFDLTVNEAQMLGGVDPFDFMFTYFTSTSDAENNVNAITDPENYTNLTNPQIIYGRYEYVVTGCEVELFQFEIQTDGALGLDDLKSNKLKVAPNPASERVMVSGINKASSYTLEVYDLSGRLIFTEFSQNESQIELDVSTLVPAVYFIKISDRNTKQFARFVRK
ncbi:MAG: T9SS type A sorting domain-containing protein [Flavobacteriaceae bacterium]|nr:T9SS type A sorting domain-containing protein [Flavobacteriaceae bacterium]